MGSKIGWRDLSHRSLDLAVSINWGGPFCGCPCNEGPTFGVYIKVLILGKFHIAAVLEDDPCAPRPCAAKYSRHLIKTIFRVHTQSCTLPHSCQACLCYAEGPDTSLLRN